MQQSETLEVNRSQLADTRVQRVALAPLAPGMIRLRVECFALTANTVTYAVAGDLLGYWDFFPSGDAAWGRVPAMGWAQVIESKNPEMTVGHRYYGWFPMSSHVDFIASATADGFRDDGPHRAKHAPVYRSYTQTEHDPLYQPTPDAEYRHALLRGLMQTAFLADDYFAEHQYFGASQVLVLSASSKTAIAFAELAAQRSGLTVLGMTSGTNQAFVERRGCYAQALRYDQVGQLDQRKDTVLVDMSGNTAVLAEVHAQLGTALKYSMAIGRSHHAAPRARVGGAVQPVFFFAPMQGKKRVEQWGAKPYLQKIAAALAAHVNASPNWLQVETHRGAEAVEAAWAELVAGGVAPERGLIASL